MSRSEHGLTLPQLVEASGLATGTTHRLALSLAACGYLTRLRRPIRYDLGPALEELLDRRRERALRRRSVLALRELAEQFPLATLILAEHVAGDIVVVLRLSPERPGVIEEPRRQILAPYSSASALLYQALWSSEERAAFRRRHPLAEYGSASGAGAQELERQLKTFRRAGYAMPVAPLDTLLRAAAPVFSPRHELLAALGAAMPFKGIEVDGAAADRVVQALLAAAAKLSGAEAPPAASEPPGVDPPNAGRPSP